ncbi:hypothetical protein [Nocardia sp. NPDC059228]|uniref:hypothetical protein n=1 Tax=Nocardia sp. NPDC059228 TaxID=3346777 RepID=UPI0036B5B6B6
MPELFELAIDYTVDPEAPTAVEQLEALPPLTIVVDRDGDVWQRRGEVWCSYETAPCTSSRLLKYKPVAVVRVQLRPVAQRPAIEEARNA